MTLSPLDITNTLLSQQNRIPNSAVANAFAPVNIALCKYWGKRDENLNLPITSSLSIALPTLGSHTQIKMIDGPHDLVTLNGQAISHESPFAKKLIAFLDLFRTNTPWHLAIDTKSDVPVAAGLASSASGFAAVVLALQQLFNWTLSKQELSILARLGSGSACRSLWDGFVLWQSGGRLDGMDSHGVPLTEKWPDLCIGLLIFHEQEKSVSSREAMKRTVETCCLYQSWPLQVKQDLPAIQAAIRERNINKLGAASERNALVMHATMMAAWPPIIYSGAATLDAMQTIWTLRAAGLDVYFTQDAGPHLKLLFLAADLPRLQAVFPHLVVVRPF
ncbi:MAG: diphosphomevalonate decarboxylase [Gammaproteobacteria bacterium]|nr:diphosphomevalonate decarboxylase [Gammaproteobacteria bacterium]